MLTAEGIKKLLRNTTPPTMQEVRSEVRDEILDRLGMMEMSDFDKAYGIIEDVMDDFVNSLRRAYPQTTENEAKTLLSAHVGTIEKIVNKEIKKQS